MPRRRQSILLILGLALSGLGCAMDLPVAERIINERPLAMRIEVLPASTEGNPVAAEGVPFDRIRAVPFIVDDQDVLSAERIEAEMEPLWLACPLQPLAGVFSCLTGELPLTLDQIEVCPTINPLELAMTGELPELPIPCRVETDTPAAPELQVPFDFNFFLGGDLELTMIAHRPGAASTERCAELLLGQEPFGTDCITLVQRASIGPDIDLYNLASLAGLDDLSEFGPMPPEQDPDTHPRIQGVRVVVVDGEVTRDELQSSFTDNEPITVERGDTVMASVGQTIVIETTTPEEDLQTYSIPSNDDDFVEREEFLAGDWYRTWGTLLGNDSDDPTSYNTWAMIPGEQDDIESDLPPDGRATLFFVQRDDRQGVDWWWFHVQVQ